MPQKATAPPGVLLISQITVQNTCDFPQGHCYGVENGKGGEQEVWTTDPSGQVVVSKDIYYQCKFCEKYTYGYKASS